MYLQDAMYRRVPTMYMVTMVGTMQTRERVLHHLKRRGPATVAELATALGLSANATRHHLTRLARDGAVTSASERHERSAGRPAQRYALTLAAEDAFPKRYPELLAAVLTEAGRLALLDRLLSGVVESWAAPLRTGLAPHPPRRRLRALLEALDYGDMLPVLSEDGEGWRLVAHNCLYRDAGCQVAGVCDLLPRVIEAATNLAAERLECQRDGRPACVFTGGWRPLP
jgi:predicted ArsR family transcriptional regulator